MGRVGRVADPDLVQDRGVPGVLERRRGQVRPGLPAGQLVQQRAQAQLVEVAAQLVQPRQLPGRVLVGGQRRQPLRRVGGQPQVARASAVRARSQSAPPAASSSRLAGSRGRPWSVRACSQSASCAAASLERRGQLLAGQLGAGPAPAPAACRRSARRSRRPSPAPSPAAAASRAGSASQTPGASTRSVCPTAAYSRSRSAALRRSRAARPARSPRWPGRRGGPASAAAGCSAARPGRRPRGRPRARPARAPNHGVLAGPHHEPAQVRELAQLVADLVGQPAVDALGHGQPDQGPGPLVDAQQRRLHRERA